MAQTFPNICQQFSAAGCSVCVLKVSQKLVLFNVVWSALIFPLLFINVRAYDIKFSYMAASDDTTHCVSQHFAGVVYSVLCNLFALHCTIHYLRSITAQLYNIISFVIYTFYIKFFDVEGYKKNGISI